MKTQRIVNIWFVAFAYAVACCILSLVAQTNGVPTVPGAATVGAFGTAQFFLDVGVPILTPILVAGIKKVMPKIPPALIPPIAISLGAIVNALGTVSLGNDPSIWKAVLLGFASIGVRELQNNFRQPSPTT
jgi:hypothetical protein